MVLCLLCRCREADIGRCCWLCAENLAELVLEVERLYQRLDPMPGRRGGGRGAPGYESTSPAVDEVIVLRDRRSLADPAGGHPAAVLNVLGGWAGLAGLPSRPTVTATAAELLHPKEWGKVLVAPWVADMAEELRGIRAVMRRILHEEDDRPIPIGACPLSITEGTEATEGVSALCGGIIRARSWRTPARCSGCGTRWSTEAEWTALAEQLGDATADIPGIAGHLGIPETTARVWAHRYRWPRQDDAPGLSTQGNRRGRALYKLSDARATYDRLHRPTEATKVVAPATS